MLTNGFKRLPDGSRGTIFSRQGSGEPGEGAIVFYAQEIGVGPGGSILARGRGGKEIVLLPTDLQPLPGALGYIIK